MREKRVSEIEFAAVQPFWSTTEERKNAAHAVLIEGVTLQEAADRCGCTRQNAKKIVNSFLAVLEKYYESQRIVREMSAPRRRRSTDRQLSQESQSAIN